MQVVMGYDPSSLFTIQVDLYIFLAQNYIILELGPFKTRLLDFVGQILKSFASTMEE